MVYRLANAWKPPSSLWDKNDFSTSASRAGSEGGGQRLISLLGIESTGKYFERTPAAGGTSSLRLDLGAFGMD